MTRLVLDSRMIVRSHSPLHSYPTKLSTANNQSLLGINSTRLARCVCGWGGVEVGGGVTIGAILL